MSYKERYFNIEHFQEDVLRIRQEIDLRINRKRDFKIIGKPALLITDMQEYFLSPASHAYVPSADAIIPGIKNMINLFRKSALPVIFTRHSNNPDNACRMKDWWRNILEKDSSMYQISPHFDLAGHHIIEKTQYDAFYMTELGNVLESENIKSLIICGLMTNLCCETTLRSAFVRGYNAILPVDLTATYNRDFHIGTFYNLSFGFCPVMTADEVFKLIKD